jgi:hypothetical protein
MYKILPASEIPMPKQPVYLGYPDHAYPDLVFVNTITLQNFISFNSILLRELLLSNKEAILAVAGVKVEDAKATTTDKVETKVEVKKEKTTPKPTEVKGEEGWK